MRGSPVFLTQLRKLVFKTALIPAAIALGVVLLGAIFAEQQNNIIFREKQRADVLNQISLIRSRLEGNINANIQLVRGLVSVVSIEPEMSQERFEQLAEHLLASDNQLRNVTAAPDMVISMIYPLAGNEAALGLDYNDNPAQREAALRARDSGQFVLAGPVDLVQGGIGFIGRFPVFLHYGEDQGSEFWGLVSAVVDADKLYADSGLTGALPIEIALAGKDGTGPQGGLFYGSATVLENDPVRASVMLPAGSWQIAAMPKGGWPASPDNLWTIRGFALLAGLLVVAPILVLGRLLNERFRNQRQLDRMSQRLELALSTTQIGVWEFDASNNQLYWDRRMRELYGVGEDDEIAYETWRDSLHPQDRQKEEDVFADVLGQKGSKAYVSQFRIVLPDGRIRYVRSVGSIEVNRSGRLRIVGVNWDVSEDVRLNEQLRHAKMLSEARYAELEAAKERIEQVALLDALTGLPNRRFLDELVERLEQEAPGRFGLLHIDLDRFKQINDTLGHAAGDAMLKHAATVLRKAVRKGDVVARIGGDEFVVVCQPDINDAQLEALASRLVEEMREPVIYEGRPCRCSVSVGIATPSSANGDARQLLINADIALYRAKNHGRNGYHFFSSELHQATIHSKQLADEILTGIEQDQFITHYQGQFDAVTHEIVGVEALVRWRHPERGVLAPAAFLDVAEDLNVLSTLDGIVLEQSLRQLNAWRRASIGVPGISVNVSARRLHDPELVSSLQKLDIEPGTLTFELVESTFLDQSEDQVLWNIDRIRELGIGIEIDDFGTGYASIVSLMQLRPQRFKIDRQLILPTVDSAAQRKLVRSIVSIGNSMGIDAIAEGVETMQHARILRDLGCTALQGYAFAKPMSGRAFARFARAHAKRHTSARRSAA